MSSGPLVVHLCSRDGPARVAVLLRDLATVVGDRQVSVTVYDDSTTAGNRASYQRVCASAGPAVRYFGEEDRRALVARARHAFGMAPDVLAASRPLGSGEWDLAGCRFTAMLDGAVDGDPSTLHLFLDDDLRLVDCRYAGRAFTVATMAIRRLLAGSELPTDSLFAAGASLVGRADMALLEHLDTSLDAYRRHAAEVAANVALAPACITSHVVRHPDSPGISGGFLLTNGLALRRLPLSRSYNEDWIWLRQLTMAAGTIHRLETPVVHCGARMVRLSLPALLYQFEGEVLDTAVRECAAASFPFEACARYVPAAFELCLGRLDATRGRASAAGLTAVRDLLDQLRDQVDRFDLGCVADTLLRHADHSRRWAESFGARPAPVPA